MGTAGAKGLGSAHIGPYLKDAGEDEAIRDKDDNTRQNYVFPSYNENFRFIDIGARAGELQQRKDITEIRRAVSQVIVDPFKLPVKDNRHKST